MRFLRMSAAARNALRFASSLPSTAAGSSTPQCSLLGFPGIVILVVLLICVGLTERLEANSDFNQQIIVHGYTRGTERAIQRTNLRSETRFAVTMIVAGAGLAAAGLYGVFVYG